MLVSMRENPNDEEQQYVDCSGVSGSTGGLHRNRRAGAFAAAGAIPRPPPDIRVRERLPRLAHDQRVHRLDSCDGLGGGRDSARPSGAGQDQAVRCRAASAGDDRGRCNRGIQDRNERRSRSARTPPDHDQPNPRRRIGWTSAGALGGSAQQPWAERPTVACSVSSRADRGRRLGCRVLKLGARSARYQPACAGPRCVRVAILPARRPRTIPPSERAPVTRRSRDRSSSNGPLRGRLTPLRSSRSGCGPAGCASSTS